MSDAAQQESKLQYFPLPMFATTMGLSGLALVTLKMEWLLGDYGWSAYLALSYFSLIIYLIILTTYTLKSLRFPKAVLNDWNHPIKSSFFPAATISLLLLGAVFHPINNDISFFLWSTGCLFQFLLSIAIITKWISPALYEVTHSTPAWFIPAVGNIIVPVAGVYHASIELSWFFFAWGMMFWVILLVLVMNRLIFHNPIPAKLLPTLFILLAPPSIGFVAYLKLVGDLDIFGRLLYYWAAFFFLLLVPQIWRLSRIKFALSWWAYTFPLTAFTSATVIMGQETGLTFFTHLSGGLYVLTCLVILMVGLRTLKGLIKCEICQPD